MFVRGTRGVRCAPGLGGYRVARFSDSSRRGLSHKPAGCLATVLGAALLVALAAPATAAVGDCGPACKRKLRSCVTAARNDFDAAKAICAAATANARACRKAGRHAKRSAGKQCRAYTRTTCKPCCAQGGVGGINLCAMATGAFLPPELTDSGDDVIGRELLLNGDFMSCGIPYALWEFPAVRPIVAATYGGTADAPTIPGRLGNNADLPYFLNTFPAPDSGVDVINANCLMCHGGQFDGELVIGLGNSTLDFTAGSGGDPTTIDESLLDALGLTQGEKDEWFTFADRGAIVGSETTMRTVGMNPAEVLAVALMVHHDRDTLAWSDAALTPVEVKDENGDPIEDAILTSDPPPWWRVHKKNALFYNGMARGDHRGTMALATSVCVDDITRAQEVDGIFKDIHAFISTIRAPAYTRTVDSALAATGETVFNRDCALCHGTYAADDDDEIYPNLLIPLDVVETDPVVANAGVIHTPELVDWYNGSFYGQTTRMEPNDPFPGYMPPPLDGIWATAPYLHNGSIPTVALLLDSGARPSFWRREDFDSTNFDEDALGWPWIAVETPQAQAPAAEQKLIYDTTYWSQSNNGHRFGDHLTDDERRAVIEYLKTL